MGPQHLEKNRNQFRDSRLTKMPFSENTHVTFTNDSGEDVVGVVKGHSGGKYSIQVRNELKTGDTHSVAEDKVKELKVSDPAPCPVAGK